MKSFKGNLREQPTNLEIEIFYKVKELFHQVSQEHAETYSSFLVSRDPCERETIARKIQSLEEAVIHQVAQEYHLSFDQVAQAFFKVDCHLGEPSKH